MHRHNRSYPLKILVMEPTSYHGIGFQIPFMIGRDRISWRSIEIQGFAANNHKPPSIQI